MGAGIVDGLQPYLRYIYVKYMGGVDLADQYLMSHAHQHRPQTFFWRRVFDQTFAQATSNAYLLFVKWAGDLLEECKLEIQELTTAVEAGPAAVAARTVAKRAAMTAASAVVATAPDMRTGPEVGGPGAPPAGTRAAEGTLGEGGGTATAVPAPLSLEELAEYLTLLRKVSAMERVRWDQRLADELMSRCQVGHAEQGGRRVERPVMVGRTILRAQSPHVSAGGIGVAREKNPVSIVVVGLRPVGCAGVRFALQAKGKTGPCTYARRVTRERIPLVSGRTSDTWRQLPGCVRKPGKSSGPSDKRLGSGTQTLLLLLLDEIRLYADVIV